MNHIYLNRLFLTAVLSVLPLLVPTTAFADTLVDGGLGAVQNEIDLTLIPGQPGKMVMAYNDFAAGNTLGIAYSSDYGATWLPTQLTMPSSPPK